MTGDVDLKKSSIETRTERHTADRSRTGASKSSESGFLRGKDRYRFGPNHSRQNLGAVGRVTSLVKSSRLSGLNAFGTWGKEETEEVNSSPWGVGTGVPTGKSTQTIVDDASQSKRGFSTGQNSTSGKGALKIDLEASSSPISTLGSESPFGTASAIHGGMAHPNRKNGAGASASHTTPHMRTESVAEDGRMAARRATSMVSYKPSGEEDGYAQTTSLLRGLSQVEVIEVNDEQVIEATGEDEDGAGEEVRGDGDGNDEGTVQEVKALKFRRSRSQASSKNRPVVDEDGRGKGGKMLGFALFGKSKKQGQGQMPRYKSRSKSKGRGNDGEQSAGKVAWYRSRSVTHGGERAGGLGSGEGRARSVRGKGDGKKNTFVSNLFGGRRVGAGMEAEGGDSEGVGGLVLSPRGDRVGSVAGDSSRAGLGVRRFMGRKQRGVGGGLDLEEDGAIDEDEIDRESVIRSLAVDDFILYQTKQKGGDKLRRKKSEKDK